MLTIDSTSAVGLEPTRWQCALDLVEQLCRRDVLPGAALLVARNGKTTGPHFFGRHQVDDPASVLNNDAIFLIASITKPIVAMGVMKLVERGLLTLDQRVTDFLPEFGQQGKHGIKVRHLLTHTSGLPDMLPTNRELRMANASLDEFVKQTCEIKPDFSAGRGVQYQSMGFAVLGAIVRQITGETCSEFLNREFFQPLGMQNTALGSPDDWYTGTPAKIERVAEIRLPAEQQAAEGWGWTSRYWRSLGAPWGGLLTTPWDLALFAQLMLNRGRCGEDVLLAPTTVEASTRNQLACLRDVPKDDRRCRPWGFGWRLHWPAHSANYGDLLGPRTYGHWGATGTVLWIDPDLQAFMVLLTTQPQEPRGQSLAQISNAVAGAFVD